MDRGSSPIGSGAHAANPRGNALLAALSAADLSILDPRLESLSFMRDTSLFRLDGSTAHVYFPDTAVISLRSNFPSGETAQVGTTGREGFAGLHVFLETRASSMSAVVQITGTIRRLTCRHFRNLLGASVGFRRLMHRYTDAFMIDVAQTAACNGVHRVTERCARWLLTARDRVGSDSLSLSHQALAAMLGVRVEGVTAALRGLEIDGLILIRRSQIVILDAPRLAAASCSCYASGKERFAGLRGSRV